MLNSILQAVFAPENQLFALALVFVAAGLIVFGLARTILPMFVRRKHVRRAQTEVDPRKVAAELDDFEYKHPGLRDKIEVYYASLQDEDENSLRRRLVNAGFLHQNAVTYYLVVRVTFSMLVFGTAFTAMTIISPESQLSGIFLISFVVGALGLFLPNFYLDSLGRRQKVNYQRAFPDFMDMMIVCTDAGLSIEAAASRVSREFLTTNKLLGVHLCIMMLEVRAGKRFREALSNMADRLDIPEAKSLAVLFRQSEELGSSLTQALRVYSEEMRQMRLLRAEEKANALPVKLVIPLAGFLFPVTMAIVVVPVMITLIKTLLSQTPA